MMTLLLPVVQKGEKHEMKDTIYRQAAVDAITEYGSGNSVHMSVGELRRRIEQLPSAQPEPKEIGYTDCADAMMKMWIDNVLTDGEYSRIMDKLNAHWAERREE